MSTIKPWVVGETAVYVVGLEGTITAMDAGSITIAGHTLPTRLNSEAGVRYLSMDWPGDPVCTREHVDDSHSEEFPEREILADLTAEIRSHHEANHVGAFRFCEQTVCRLADRADAEVLV